MATADLEDELAAFVEALTTKYERAGMTRDVARRAALIETGSLGRVKDDTRDVYVWHAVETLWRDMRHGARSLVRSPGFSCLVTATLTLCVGLSVTMFAVVDGVMWRPLPYPESDRLVAIDRAFGPAVGALAPGELVAIRDSVQAFTYVGAASGAEAFIAFDGQLERVSAASATDDVLPLLGAVPMQLGRPLESRVDAGTPTVRSVVLSDRLWRRVYGAAPDLIGRRVQVNDIDLEVVGVLPPDLRVWLPADAGVSEETDVWFPLADDHDLRARGASAVARLAPGVELPEAAAELNVLAARLRQEHAAIYADAVGELAFRVRPLRAVVAEPVARGLVALAASVAFVLIIGGVNIANLLLARAKARERDVAVRAALGAGRLRLLRQFLAEHAILALAGGAAGILVAQFGIVVLTRLGSNHLPRQSEIGLDSVTVLVGFALSAALVAACGAVSALRQSRPRETASLVSARTRTALAGRRRLQRSLVVAQVALSVAPLFGAGLMIQSFRNLTDSPLGFDPANVLTARVGISLRRFPDPANRWLLYQDIVEAVRGVPGVDAVSGVSPVPFERTDTLRFRSLDEGRAPVVATQQVVLPGYLDIVHASLREGRDFSNADISARANVAVVDETFARAMWGEEQAVGQRFIRGSGNQRRELEVIGVMRRTQVTRVLDADRTSVRSETLPHVLVPYHVSPIAMTLIVGIRGEEVSAETGLAIKRAVEALGTTRAVYDVRPMTSYVQGSIVQNRFSAFVLFVLAAASLLMSAVGVYGTLAYLVGQRTHEFAVRLALGATMSGIVRLVAWEGTALTIVGALLGLAGAFGVGRMLESLLYGVTAVDASILLGACALLGFVALVAVIEPACRAARINPRRALEAD